jgi:hypothetical protein
MFMTEVKFDEAIENAFKRGIAFQKANQRELENAWFDIGYNAACKEHGINQFVNKAELAHDIAEEKAEYQYQEMKDNNHEKTS